MGMCFSAPTTSAVFVCSSICPGADHICPGHIDEQTKTADVVALNAAGGVTETRSVYGAIADATGFMSIETDVPADVFTDATGGMSSPSPVLDIFSPPAVPLTSAVAKRRQYLR
jgi:hypothetical protein